MKRKTFFLGFGIIFLSAIMAYSQTFGFGYEYKGRFIELRPLKDQLTVEFKKDVSKAEMRRVLSAYLNYSFKIDQPVGGSFMPLILLNRKLDQSDLLNLIDRLQTDPEIDMAAPVFTRIGSRVRQTVNRTFLARFESGVTEQEIASLNNRYGAEILKRFPENTFLLQIKPEKRMNGLQAANLYDTEEGVIWAQPNFYYMNWELLNYSVNDQYWQKQWAHKNTGQSVVTAADSDFPQYVNGYPDADMDVDLAWDALINHGLQAGGSADILIGMLDSGVDLDHPDLENNLFSTGIDYTPDNGSDANDVQGHGTSTAGIVAAEGDNGIGVAGIAFRSKILPLKIFTLYGSADDAGFAEAMDYAWQQGSDVISNSWSGTSPNSALDDAIRRAKTQGRGGKGSVVVFSSGNGGSGNVSYPAYLEDVIAVGSSNMFDEKKNPGSKDFQRDWGGNYGAALDLVAPSIVYSTDIAGSGGYVDGDYFDHFGGTSASCPQVSGVAALVLAADSNLTSDQVQDILQRSADKIDRYAFDENGWNRHVGYGRVNAYRAVLLAYNENGDVPLISHTMLQPTSSVDPRIVSAVISDNDGIPAAENQPTLFYRTIFQGDTSSWFQVTDPDGPTGNQYDFTIPAQSWGTEVEYYVSAWDNSADQRNNTFPFKGDDLTLPPEVLRYYVGDFTSQTYTSSDVPVSIPDDNVFYTSTLNVADHQQIVDLNATISISGYIEDLAVALEAPDNNTASGIVSHNGDVGDSYSNTTLDDEASTPITDGASPYSGTFQPDNGLFVFDGKDAAGTWTLRVFDDTYYNNGGSIDNWSLNITYLKPLHPPVVSDIPDQTVEEGSQFAQFDLDDYVTDEDNTDDEISWTADGNTELTVSIDTITHVVTITTPDENWNGSETITFTATDPSLLSDSDSATTVTPVNDPPVVSDIPGQTIEEGGTFSPIPLDDYVSDVDNPDSELTWQVSGNQDLIVQIDPQTHIATISVPDENWNGQETLTFTATDPGGLSDSDTATFKVTPVNDAPVVSDIPDQTVSEGESFNSFDLDDYVSDVDNTDAEIIWTYSGNTDLIVQIDDQTHVTTVSAPNEDWNGSETITFTATDPGGLSDQDPATFTVTAVNDTPVVSDIPDQTIDEGQSFAQIVLDDYVSDPDNSDTEITWTYSGNKELQVNIDANRIATVTAPDTNWNGQETITFIATDPGGLSDRDSAVFKILPVDDPPKFISALPELSFREDDSLFISFSFWFPFVDDADNPDSTLVFNLGQGKKVNTSDSDGGHLLKSFPDWFGEDTLKIMVSDGVFSDSSSFNVRVLPVNDPPQIVRFPDSLVLFRGDTLRLSLKEFEADIDSPSDSLYWSFSTADSNLRFQYQKSAKELFLFSENFKGYSLLFSRLIDDSGAFALDTSIIHVKDSVTAIGAQNLIALEYNLFQNFPNPFNPTTTIRYSLKEKAFVRLDVFNVKGQLVKKVVSGLFPAGTHEIPIDGSDLASGIYFYRLIVLHHKKPVFVRIKKMILLK
ncbi:MAG: S8 family serine peptidase [Calditrichaeota bacterium]|nr:S8 family serine peptidase [Calditrichota bacterium]